MKLSKVLLAVIISATLGFISCSPKDADIKAAIDAKIRGTKIIFKRSIKIWPSRWKTSKKGEAISGGQMPGRNKKPAPIPTMAPSKICRLCVNRMAYVTIIPSYEQSC